MRLRSFAILGILYAFPAAAEPQYSEMRVNFDVGGSFAENALKQLGTKEGAAIVEGVCAAFGGDCSQEAEEGAYAIHTAFSANKSGSDYRGDWVAPDSYVVCKAKIDWAHTGIDGGTTFNAWITPDRHSLHYYVSLGSGGGHGHGVNSDLYIQFVKPEEVQRYSCFPTYQDHTSITSEHPLLWQTKGPNGERIYPGARYP